MPTSAFILQTYSSKVISRFRWLTVQNEIEIDWLNANERRLILMCSCEHYAKSRIIVWPLQCLEKGKGGSHLYLPIFSLPISLPSHSLLCSFSFLMPSPQTQFHYILDPYQFIHQPSAIIPILSWSRLWSIQLQTHTLVSRSYLHGFSFYMGLTAHHPILTICHINYSTTLICSQIHWMRDTHPETRLDTFCSPSQTITYIIYTSTEWNCIFRQHDVIGVCTHNHLISIIIYIPQNTNLRCIFQFGCTVYRSWACRLNADHNLTNHA